MNGSLESEGAPTMALHWGSITSPTLGGAIDATTTVLIPWGAIEAHGPHLPISTDCYVAEGLAELIAARLGNSIVAPTIPFGYAPRTNYPGTISVNPTAILPLLLDLLRGYSSTGAGSIALIPAHAEDFQFLSLFAPLLAENTDCLFLPFLDLNTFMNERAIVLESFEVNPQEGGWHAGASETSVMLALRPDLVRMDRAVRGFLDADYSRKVAGTLVKGYRSLNADGVMGDATLARAEIGTAILERLADRFVDSAQERGNL